MKIAFLGVGLMGAPMIENLIQAGHDLVLWNRTASKAEAFAGRAVIAATPAQAIAQAECVITMLENGPVVRSVALSETALAAYPKGGLLIDMSSSPPELAREIAGRLQVLDCDSLDAPVSGGTVGAKAASLSIMAGGPECAFQRAKPVFAALGHAHYMGAPGTGQLAKLANQSIVGVTIGAVAEALLLAERGGADPAALREALLGGFAQSRILELHGQRMIERSFEPGARSRVQLKDMNTIVDQAQQLGLSLPLAKKTQDLYEDLLRLGHESLDHSALYLALEALNPKKEKQA